MSDEDSAERFIGASLHDDRYAVSGVLGEGSQGATLEAIDKRDGTLVAIKRFQVRGARSWKDVELAEREAKVLSRLSHQLLPRHITHFEQDGALYLVMDRIEGKTLAQEGKLSRADVIRFLYDADEVLHYLHQQAPPVIHRDIKPSNVIRHIGDDGRPHHMLVDFGSVRDTLKPAGGSTVVGTFGYMAPEQFQGRARPQSDIYGVGATALAMLTGQEPEELPHRGLAIDVAKAIPDDEAMVRVLTKLVEPDPDVRPTRILPLLRNVLPERPKDPKKPKRSRRSDKKQRKRDRRAKRREARAARRATRSESPVPALVLPIVVIALGVARVAVSVSLRAIVPTLLSLLSLVFGAGLRRAAKSVSGAGVVADEALHRATLRVMGRSPDDAASSESEPPERLRVDVEPKPRVAVQDALDHAEEEVTAALEEVADELEAWRKPKRRR